MMLLDPDPAGEITASLSRDTRGIGNVVRRLNLHCSVAAITVSSGQCGRGMHSAEVLGAAPNKCVQRVKKRKNESSGQVYTVEEGPDRSRFTRRQK